MKIYVGVTDYDWFTILKNAKCDEVNFWRPGTGTNFSALQPNDLFLFKLHSPRNYIVGGGYFVRYSILPTFLAWDAFGIQNGTRSLEELNKRILKYKKHNGIDTASDSIGCIILTEPFFFEENDWIPVPEDWSNSIVQGKTYLTETEVGLRLFSQVEEKLKHPAESEKTVSLLKSTGERYGSECTTRHRLGQGSFRIVVTEAYNRRCAITGEKTLPVLNAAHIRPYSEEGPHSVQNGLLLRTDLHALFDKGYITIDDKYIINVSNKLYEDYGNGKIYYAHHGQKLFVVPTQASDQPSGEFLNWHNEHVYLG